MCIRDRPYFADTPQGKVRIPADWDSLEIANTRIGVYAESIGARADITDKADVEEVEEVEEVEQPEENVETTQPEPVEVAEDHEAVELAPAEEINEAPAADAQSQQGVTPTKPAKDEPKAEAKVKVEELKPAKAEAPKQADNQPNIAAIIGGVIAALAALGIGAAFFAMR